MPKLIAYIVTGLIVIFAIRILWTSLKNSSNGKCTGCISDCKKCGIKNIDEKEDKKGL